MSKKDNIYLIGPMGAGKTTIGKKLARKLKKIFIDTDLEIEKKTGASINLIFDIEGEDGFRQWESKIINSLVEQENIVLATGGGAILCEANRNILKENGIVVYLEASADLIMKRTAYDSNRPLLATENRLKTINELLSVRTPIYEMSADITITVDKKPAGKIINEICIKLEIE